MAQLKIKFETNLSNAFSVFNFLRAKKVDDGNVMFICFQWFD
jgi:hypothetical protein